jgi:hypothetical protein
VTVYVWCMCVRVVSVRVSSLSVSLSLPGRGTLQCLGIMGRATAPARDIGER